MDLHENYFMFSCTSLTLFNLIIFRTAVKTSHIWLSVLLVILIVCSSIISLFITWQHMLDSSKERDNMDFLMFGPTRSVSGKIYSNFSSRKSALRTNTRNIFFLKVFYTTCFKTYSSKRCILRILQLDP